MFHSLKHSTGQCEHIHTMMRPITLILKRDQLLQKIRRNIGIRHGQTPQPIFHRERTQDFAVFIQHHRRCIVIARQLQWIKTVQNHQANAYRHNRTRHGPKQVFYDCGVTLYLQQSSPFLMHRVRRCPGGTYPLHTQQDAHRHPV